MLAKRVNLHMEYIVLLVLIYNCGTKNRTSQNMRPTAAYNVTRLYQSFNTMCPLRKTYNINFWEDNFLENHIFDVKTRLY